MKNVYLIIFALILGLGANSLSFADGQAIFKKHLKNGMNKGKAIAQTADDMDKGYKSQKSRMNMILVNASGDKIIRRMDSQRYEQTKDGDLSLFRFLKPADIRGTGLLTFEHKTRSDDQWLYLPARKRTKRISSDNKSGSFMGSEFSYEDMGSREVEKYRYKFLRTGKYNGKACYIIERYPTERSSGYSKLVTWVQKSNFQPLKIDYYDRKREHLKTLLFKRYKKLSGKYWRAHELIMENVQTDKKTTLKFTRMKVKVGLTKAKFTKSELEDW